MSKISSFRMLLVAICSSLHPVWWGSAGHRVQPVFWLRREVQGPSKVVSDCTDRECALTCAQLEVIRITVNQIFLKVNKMNAPKT